MKKILYLSLAIPLQSFAMEPIEKWEDAIPFTGKFVLYTPPPSYFSCKNRFVINQEDPELIAGYVSPVISQWRDGDKGYELRRLTKLGCVTSACFIINSLLKRDGVLAIRESTREEKLKMKEALDGQQAEFAYSLGREKELLDKEFSDKE